MADEVKRMNLFVSPHPHFSQGLTTKKIMLTVCASLLPLCVWGVYLFGIRALITILVSVAACIAFDFLYKRVTKRGGPGTDGSAIVTGLLLAMVLPPAIPVWMTILGALFAIVAAKEFFGGLGANVFNPALSGRAMLFISFPAAMTSWVAPFDGVSGATVLSGKAVSYVDMFIGREAGCIGESSALLILIAFGALLALKIIDWRAPVAMVAVVAVCTIISGNDVTEQVLSGGLLFGAVFMTTDYTTSPVTRGGRLVFGAGCGLITFLIRQFGGYPEGVMFSILIMNIVSPFLNNIIPKKYGYVKPVKKGGAK